MDLFPHPGYEELFNVPTDQHEVQKRLARYRDYSPPENLDVRDETFPGHNGTPKVKVRLYKRKGLGVTPLLINIHGGGFVSGDLDNDNHRCTDFALNVDCTVVSVDYRLAPQHPFPAALEDNYAVLMHLFDHADRYSIDKDRIAVFGTSAGGNMAAALCLLLRDTGGPEPRLQILNFPGLDAVATTNSAKMFWEGTPFVQGKGISGVMQLYLGGYDGTQPSYYAIPSLARDLSGLPAAVIITCEYDPLRDEGIQYAQRLMEFGVPTELYSLPRVPHGFDLVSAPLTGWMRQGLYMSIKREFRMK